MGRCSIKLRTRKHVKRYGFYHLQENLKKTLDVRLDVVKTTWKK